MKCPVPDCQEELRGRNAVLCPDHFFALPQAQSKFLISMKCRASRSTGEKRAHLESQLEGYIASAVRLIANPDSSTQKSKESDCVS